MRGLENKKSACAPHSRQGIESGILFICINSRDNNILYNYIYASSAKSVGETYCFGANKE
jgi:hypothetical protein